MIIEVKFMYLFLFFLSSAIFFSARWAFDYFGLSCFEQIPFHLKVSLEGTNKEFIFDWFKMCGTKSVLLCFLLYIFTYVPLLSAHVYAYTLLICILLIVAAGLQVGFFEWIMNQFRKTNLYEKYFVDTKDVHLTFPEKKRNLIVIYVESLETTYTSKKNGGNYPKDLIPELSSLANDYINFSHQKKLGGAQMVAGTGWTTGGLVASSAGVGLTVPLSSKRFTKDAPFLSQIKSLGDILEEQGYNQELCIGSDASFGGRRNYFSQHGNYTIWDTHSAKDYLPENYQVFWGYEDKKLFEFAKKEITRLSQLDAPFNFQCLTVDTHHPKGYLDENAKEIYPERLSNIIRFESHLIGEFIEWIQDQPFYNNTSIVITGDHTSMAAQYINHTYDKNYQRTTLNVFINSSQKPFKEKNRQFTSFDLFPTILSSLGVKIEGERLGFGTNLFSKKKTLVERMPIKKFDQELRKQSSYYKNHIL